MTVRLVDADHGLGAFGTSLGKRPLIICDVDEVVLRFVAPFKAFLLAHDHRLDLDTFSLNGNVTCVSSGKRVADATVGALLTGFYDHQEDWQVPFEAARPTLARLSAIADVVLLTAMPPSHAAKRKRLLERHDFTFPLIATEQSKGLVVRQLAEANPPRLIFIDDMLYNCRAVTGAAPEALVINLLIDDDYHAIAPVTEAPAVPARGWSEVEALIRAHISTV